MSVNLSVRTYCAADTTAVGRALSGCLRAGDLLILRGDLGAGKTTLTQGIGLGLGVEGKVTSPTFIIAREHRSTGVKPPLIHADAYRIDSIEQLETLDLDTSLEQAVTVVEWGDGKVEEMSEDFLLITLNRVTPNHVTLNRVGHEENEHSQESDTAHDWQISLDEDTDLESGSVIITITSQSARWDQEILRKSIESIASTKSEIELKCEMPA